MRYVYALLLVVLFIHPSLAQQAEKIDSAANAQIRDEGMNRSQVMEVLSYISDIYGPRLSGTPAYRAAAEWARARLESIGLSNPHLEGWGPFGRGWTLKHYSANVIGRQVFPLISYPKAWSPGTGGKLTAEIVYLDASSDSALEAYHGKLKGKFVLMGDARELKPPFEPEAQRMADTSLLKLANSDLQRSERMRRFDMGGPDRRTRALLAFHKLELCQNEGVAGVLTASFGDGGNVFVDAATVPVHPDTPYTKRVSAHDLNPPKIPTQVSVGAEHFNRLVRMIQKGEHPKLEMELEVNFNRADSGYNIIAELPGTDLKDEIVMIGGHFDSWHGGTGATDNGTGSAVCIEAMRILKTLKLQPRRTIRIGLWDAEEYGFYGSRAYVTKHFAEREGGQFDPAAKITYKPEWEKFSVYFNNDNGGGKVRGVWMQGNEAVRPIFRAWLRPFRDLGAATLTPLNTGGTDHQTFDGVGLPGFQFIQDEIDYGTRTHHSTMDLYDRVVPDDLKQAATIMAAFAYDAAMRDERIPRKPLPTPQAPAGR